MAAPNLRDPAERAAYFRELNGVARGARLAGLLVVVAGALLLVAHRLGKVDVPLLVPVVVMGLGTMVLITAISARMRYHALRMRE